MKVLKSKYVGNWAGRHCRCPVCNAELLKNKLDDLWCSNIQCNYERIKLN